MSLLSPPEDTLNTLPVPARQESPFHRLRRDENTLPGNGPIIYEEVIGQIKTLLEKGQYQPGDKLPPERELAEGLGVNRNAVREAIRALTVMGVIQTRPQSGSHLSSNVEGMLRLPFEFLMLMLRPSYEEIQEVRGLIEVYAAGRAAERRTNADLLHIEAALHEMRANNEGHSIGQAGGGAANRHFHRTVVAAAQNRLLEYVLFCLLEARSAYIRAISPNRAGRRENIANHERILDAIRRQDPEAAREAMRVDMGVAVRVGQELSSPAPTTKDAERNRA